VGGSRAFGPVVRSHEVSLPKKVRRMALKHALSSKAKSGDLIVLDAATIDSPKTAALLERFTGLGWSNALIIAGAEVDNNLKLAARNIPQVDVLPNAGLNVYDVLRRDKLVMTRDAVEAITSRLTEEAA
jgi:large subunit ribosomal protein L4